MRVNWFSSSEDGGSRSAVYSETVLPYLKAQIDVRVWEQGECSFSPSFWTEVNSRDLSIYVIDRKSTSSNWVHSLSQLCPGINILLSSHLPFLSESQLPGFRAALLQSYGISEVNSLIYNMAGVLERSGVPFYQMERGLGLVTHSKKLSNELSSFFSYPVAALPIPINQPKGVQRAVSQRVFRKIALQLPSDAGRYFQHVVERFPQYQFEYLKPFDTPSEDTDLLASLVLSRWEVLFGVQVALTRGIPCIVRGDGWTHEISTVAVQHLKLGWEDTDLLQWLQDLHLHGGHFSEKVRAGSEYLCEVHNPSLYARNLINFCLNVWKTGESFNQSHIQQRAKLYESLIPSKTGWIDWKNLN